MQTAGTSEAPLPSAPRATSWSRSRALACIPILALLGLLLVSQRAAAQGPRDAVSGPVERRILVLRGDDRPRSPVETRVDRVLGQVLGELGFIVNVSPMPFHDAQLATGCTGSIGKCGEVVAAALESEQLAVSVLDHREGEDQAELVLYLFANGVSRDAITQLSVQPTHRLELQVRELAYSVYAGAAPEPRVTAARPPPQGRAQPKPEARRSELVAIDTTARAPELALAEPRFEEPREPKRNHALLAAGWSATAVGAALLVSGIGTSLASREASDDYARRDISNRDDADRALASYARAERQADASRVLFGMGGGILVTGTALLLWEKFASRRSDRKLQNPPLQIAPVPIARGAAVTLSSSFGRRSW